MVKTGDRVVLDSQMNAETRRKVEKYEAVFMFEEEPADLITLYSFYQTIQKYNNEKLINL